MSTNASRPDKTDGTDRPTADTRRTVRNDLKQAIHGPDAQCGNRCAAVIAYAQRTTTAAFPDVTATLQTLIDCGVVGFPEQLAIHTCRDTPNIHAETARTTRKSATPESPTTHTAALQQCADALQPITDVQAADICTDNPHLNHPVLEIVGGPDTHAPPQVLHILAAYHCGLRGLHTRQHPQSWVLEAVCPGPAQSPASTIPPTY